MESRGCHGCRNGSARRAPDAACPGEIPCSAMDAEWVRQRAIGQLVDILDPFDVRSRRSHLERAPQPLERGRLSACLDLDLAAGAVGHPAAQAEATGFLAREPAEADSLHTTVNAHVQARHLNPAPTRASR